MLEFLERVETAAQPFRKGAYVVPDVKNPAES